MNLSFLKISTKKSLSFWVILSFFTVILANDSIPDQTFIERCKNSDAYLVFSYTDVAYPKSWINYSEQISYHSKIVINTKSGVENYAFLNLNNFDTDHLKRINIKTLKADGTIVELDSSLIFKHKPDDEQLGQIRYPIPGVEPGDTIEIFYIYSVNKKIDELMDFVNLYNSVPSLNTEFTISTSPDLLIIYKPYNSFPEPQVVLNDTLLYCLFKMENVDGLTENQYTCLLCELPYLYYSVEKAGSEIRTWKDVYNQEYNFITQPILVDYEKSSYYRRWKRKVIGEANDSSKYYKFNLLYEDILSNYQILPFEEGNLLKSNGYFLKEGYFDPISIRRLYRQLLEDLEIDYWAVFARSKRLGQIDPYYIRKGEFDHIFFAYENDNGSLNLLYPHNVSYKYQINEIPTSLYNTQAVMAKPYLTKKIKKSDKFINYDFKLAEADSVITNIIILPGLSADYNYLKQVFYCNVDLKQKSSTFDSKFSVSGGLSTDIRSFFSLLNQNEEMNSFYEALAEFEETDNAWEIDTVTKTDLNKNKPFIYNISAQGDINNSLSYLNDSLVSITLDNFIQHTEIESETDSIDLNYYLDYSYKDLCMFILIFPCDIEVMNIDSYNQKFKNTYGEYSFSINLVGNNQLILQSSYKITKDMIPKDDYWQLKQLNEQIKEIKNKRLLIKLKKS